MVVAQPPLGLGADQRLTRARQVARHGGFVFARDAADLRERHLLGIVTAKPQAIARLERGERRRQHGLHRRHKSCVVGVTRDRSRRNRGR